MEESPQITQKRQIMREDCKRKVLAKHKGTGKMPVPLSAKKI
jgi:hypothetical protein